MRPAASGTWPASEMQGEEQEDKKVGVSAAQVRTSHAPRLIQPIQCRLHPVPRGPLSLCGLSARFPCHAASSQNVLDSDGWVLSEHLQEAVALTPSGQQRDTAWSVFKNNTRKTHTLGR